VLKTIFTPSSSNNLNQSSRWPSSFQWSQIFKILSKREKNLIFLCLFLFVASVGFVGFRYYLINTQTVPSRGGSYSEGIIGAPRFLNPVLAPTNDADRDLTRIIFSSLLKYDSQGNLMPDLAESYNVLDSGKTYEIYLKKNAFWHDGRQVTADDVIYTLQVIQDSDFRSPLRVNWVGIDVEKIDNFGVRFRLKNAYAPFPFNLTFGILPKHVWQNISASDFALNEKNLKPIGSGPYVFKQLVKNTDGSIKSIELAASKNFYLPGPFIEQLNFKFYTDEDTAVAALRKADVQGLSYISPANYTLLKNDTKNTFNIFEIKLPRYFALFFNQTQNKALADKNVRIALAQALDKEKLISDTLLGFGEKIDSPIIPGMLGFSDDIKIYSYDFEAASSTLSKAGWLDKNNDGIREKDGQNLEFTISTIPWQELAQTAEFLKVAWSAIGVKVNIETKETANLIQENIRPRQYQALLFGELLNIDPDPFAFWHSSQVKDPGQNLSLYENAQVDAILQDARQDQDAYSRAKKYQQFNQIIAQDLPAIFLYAPQYLYPVSANLKGADLKIMVSPSDRFSQIENWYITTRRAWK
jgi:peptide/nickel transport system substrate-binding protein